MENKIEMIIKELEARVKGWEEFANSYKRDHGMIHRVAEGRALGLKEALEIIDELLIKV